METIAHVWKHVSDYVLWSASFGTTALALSMYFTVKAKEPIWSIKNIPNLLILLSILGGGYLAFTSGDEVDELHAKTRNIEELRKIEERYGRWAKLTATGLSPDGSDPYVHHTLKPAWVDTNEGQVNPTDVDCSEVGLEVLKKGIDRYPDFPFSYVYLAACYAESHNPEWRSYAKEALRILENTTKVLGHHRHHDRMLELVKEWLQDDADGRQA